MVYSLTAPGASFTHANVQGGVTYTESVNAGDNITLGSCVANKIEFTVLDLYYTEMLHYAGTEFDFAIHDMLPYGFAEDDLLITRDGERYYFPANQRHIGKFTVLRPERLDESKWKFTGIDRMARFDRVVDDWFAGLTYPLTSKTMLMSLCAYCGVELLTQSFPNDDFAIQRNIVGSGIKGRDVLSWIAELAASYARITQDGKLELAFYAPTGATIDRMIQVRASDYEVQQINKLQVQATENDIGVIVGTGTNTYIIQGNPLLITESDGEIRSAVEAIFDRIKGLPLYTPMELETYGEYAGCRAGDIVQVQTRRGTYTTCITGRVMTGEKATLTGVGAENRRQVRAVNRYIQQLRGKTNEIIATVDALSVTLTEYRADTDGTLTTLSSRIAQNATSITSEVTRATAAEGTLSSRITQTDSALSAQIEGLGGRTASLELTLQGFTAAVGGSKLVFDEDGLTCYRGGFRINNGTEDVLAIEQDGSLSMMGDLVNSGDNKSVKIHDGSIRFYSGGVWPAGRYIGAISSLYGANNEGFITITSSNIHITGDTIFTGKINSAYWQAGTIYVPNVGGTGGTTHKVVMWY